MKTLVMLLAAALLAAPASAQGQPAPGAPVASAPVASGPPAARRDAAQARVPPNQAAQAAQQRAAMGDLSGGRFIPKPILEILADPRIEPNIAYIFWQTARKPMEDWTLNELVFVTQTAPTLVEAGIAVGKLQALYEFLGLDPGDLFNPQLGQNWQSRSTAFDRSANGSAISSADCQADPGQMTVATFQTCTGGGAQ